MTAQCPICRSPVEVDDAKISGEGLKVTCPLCEEVFLVRPPSAQSAAPVSGTKSVATPSHGHTNSSGAASGSGSAAASASRRLLEEDSGDGAAPRVLVAHDSFTFGETVKTLLEEEGFDVEVVHDGDAAMEVLDHRVPAVAILEAALPKRFGFQICADIRGRLEPVPVKLLLVASIYDRKRMGRSPAMSAAPDEFLEPRNLELELVPKVKRLLRGREGTGSRPAAPSSQSSSTKSVDVSRAEIAPRAPEVLPPAPKEKRKDPTHPTHPTMGEEDFADLFEESATGARSKSVESELPREEPPIDDIEAFLSADSGNGKSVKPAEPDPPPMTVTPARGRVAPKSPLRIGDEPNLGFDSDSEEREIWDKVAADDEEDEHKNDDDELLRSLMEMAGTSASSDDEDDEDESDDEREEPESRSSGTELGDDDLGLGEDFASDEPKAAAPKSELDEILDQVSTSRPAVEVPVATKRKNDDILRVDEFLSSEIPSDYGRNAEGPTDRAASHEDDEPSRGSRVPSAGPLDIPSRGSVPDSWKPDADERRIGEETDEEAALHAILGDDSARSARASGDDDDDALVDEDDDEKDEVVTSEEEDDDDASQRATRAHPSLLDAPTEIGGVLPNMPTDTPTVLRKGTKSRDEDPLDRITEDFDEEDEERSSSSPPPVVMEGDDAPLPQSSFATEALDDEKSLAEIRVKKDEDGDSELDDLLESSLGGKPVPASEAPGDTRAQANGNGNGGRLRDEHDKAKRLAKLIVGDILLYNAEKIPEAVKTGTFFEVMKGDIKDGREFYDEKVPDEVRAERDYIQELLQETLDRKKKELGLT